MEVRLDARSGPVDVAGFFLLGLTPATCLGRLQFAHERVDGRLLLRMTSESLKWDLGLALGTRAQVRAAPPLPLPAPPLC